MYYLGLGNGVSNKLNDLLATVHLAATSPCAQQVHILFIKEAEQHYHPLRFIDSRRGHLGLKILTIPKALPHL